MPFDLTIRRPRRIALFSGNYNYVMDGPVRALNKLVAYLEAQGIEVLVFAPTVKKPAFQHEGTLVSVPSIPIPGRSEYRVGLALTPALKRRLKAFNPDLIHLAAPDILGTSALRWARKNGVPAVSSFHTRFDTYPRYYGMAWMEKYLTNHMRGFYDRVEHTYVPSQSMADQLSDDGIGRDLRIWTRGVDTDLFTPEHRDMAWRRSLGFKDDEIVITFVGRLVLEKGLAVYARVLDALTQKGLKVRGLIVGEGPARERFEARLPNAVFVGFQSGNCLGRAYASSDIFFNGSVTETFGNVTLEAMAAGLPTVCADATGSRSLVEEGKSGYLIPLNANGEADLDQFIARMETLVTDSTLRQSMGARALARSTPYTWDAVLGDLLTNYGSAMENYVRPDTGLLERFKGLREAFQTER